MFNQTLITQKAKARELAASPVKQLELTEQEFNVLSIMLDMAVENCLSDLKEARIFEIAKRIDVEIIKKKAEFVDDKYFDKLKIKNVSYLFCCKTIN